MKAVLDTNVVISAALTPDGSPGKVIMAWRAKQFRLVTSRELMDEVTRVLARQRIRHRLAWSGDEVREFLDEVEYNASFVAPTEELRVIPHDPADNRVLEAAVTAEADYIVTGDRHLLELDSYEGVGIVMPARFLALLALP